MGMCYRVGSGNFPILITGPEAFTISPFHGINFSTYNNGF